MRQDFVDRSLRAVLLEVEKCFPDFGVEKRGRAKVFVRFSSFAKELLKNVVEGFVVNELRRMILVNLCQVQQHVVFYVSNQVGIGPKFVKPNL